MRKGTSGKTFAALVEEICRREGSIAQAARKAGVDRGWLSKVAKGTEKPPSLERLEEMIARWKPDRETADALRQSALWEKANPAARKLLRESGYLEKAPPTAAPARTTVLMRHSDVRERLYSEYVPVIGDYSREGIIPPADYSRDDEGDFLPFGPVPEGSVALKLIHAAAGFSEGDFLVFGPEMRPHPGLGLFQIKRSGVEFIAVCRKGGRRVEAMVEGEVKTFAREKIVSFRPFVARV